MNKINQLDTWSCIACVAAMITGEELKDVVEFIGHDGSGFDSTTCHPFHYEGFSILDIMKYLLDRKFMLGIYLVSMNGCRMDVSGEDIEFTIPINRKALVTVASERFPDQTRHTVYWDGEVVLDPNPDVKGLRKLSDYNVIEWWSILEFE